MVSKAEALRRLTAQQSTPEHREAFADQVLNEANDRGSSILLVADLENALDAALCSVLFGNDLRRLYSDDGPLATFSRKSELAYALRIVGPVTYGNLRIVRHVRNAFAHAKIPINFTTEEIAAICDDLVLINPIPSIPHARNQAEKTSLSPRLTFADVCKCTAYHLYFFALEPILRFETTALRPEIDEFPEYEDLQMRKKPLP